MTIQPVSRLLCLATVGGLCLLGATLSAQAATYTVTTTADSGAGSLRQAILDAKTAGFGTIEFNIPGTGLHTITPVTNLPDLPNGATTVDGFSQPGSSPNTLPNGSNAVLRIEIRGPGSGGDGLRGPGSFILRGLVINGWNGTATSAGVHQTNGGFGVGGTLIEGCYIGTDTTGTVSVPNSIGIFGESPLKMEIGHAFNVASVLTADGSRNIISGNTSHGLRLLNGGSLFVGSIIAGNHFGIDASGVVPMGNGGDGVRLENCQVTQLGNTTTQSPGLSDGNLIGGNGAAGLRINGGSFNYSFMTVIGTDLSGTIPLGNASSGLIIENGATDVSFNGFSDRPGIIAFNGGGGFVVTGTAVRAALSGTHLYGNTGLNLDLGNNGQTANDACDADTGPNFLQNKAVLTGAPDVFGALHVQGSLMTEMNKNYNIAYYVSSSCTPANPAASKYAGESHQINPGASCTANFDHTLNIYPSQREAGEDFIVGIVSEFNSGVSEISNCVALPSFVTPGVNLNLQMTAAPDPATEGLPLVYTLNVRNNGATTGNSVNVSGSLPQDATYLIGDSGCSYSSGADSIVCSFGTVAGNGGLSTKMVSIVPGVPGVVSFTATASSNVPDDNIADDTDTVVTPVSMAIYDFEAINNGTSFTCPAPTTKQVCQLNQTETFLNNGSTWLSGSLELTSTCKKLGTVKVSCKLKGGFTVNSFNPLGVAANEVTAYLSNDTTVDSGDLVLVSSPSIALAALAVKHKAVKIKYKHPKGTVYTGQYLLIKLDSLDAVTETDENNNVLVLGVFP